MGEERREGGCEEAQQPRALLAAAASRGDERTVALSTCPFAQLHALLAR